MKALKTSFLFGEGSNELKMKWYAHFTWDPLNGKLDRHKMIPRMGSSSQSYMGNKGTLDNIINNNNYNDNNNKQSCKHRWKIKIK